MLQTNLSIDGYSRIKVLEVLSIGVANDTNPESFESHFPAIIKWCDPETETHVAELAPEELVQQDTVMITSLMKIGIVPGVYRRSVLDPTKFEIEEKKERQEPFIRKKRSKKAA